MRVVCATNRKLEQEIENGTFRSDLFYRINVVNLHLPALRERASDIPELVDYFLQYHNRKYNCRAKALSTDMMTELRKYHWPGNIRELENVIHYALIVCRDNTIEADDLKLVGALHRKVGAAQRSQTVVASANDAPLVVPVIPVVEERNAMSRLIDLFGEMIATGEAALFDSVEETLVRTAYARCNNNQVQTARVLGISRNILRTHLKRFGLIGAELTAEPMAEVADVADAVPDARLDAVSAVY